MIFNKFCDYFFGSVIGKGRKREWEREKEGERGL